MINKERIRRLGIYVDKVMKKEDGKELYLAYKEDLDQVKPQECFEIYKSKLDQGHSPGEILETLDRVINVFYEPLLDYKWEKPEEDTFLDILIRENLAFEKKLNQIKDILREKNPQGNQAILLEKVKELEAFNDHYLKKENILFPYMEKKLPRFEGLTIMWSLHDKARQDLRETIKLLEKDQLDEKAFNRQIGRLFFTLMGLIRKEDLILFPSAAESLNKEDFQEMNQQSLDYSFPFIDRPHIEVDDKREVDFTGLSFRTRTGELDFQELQLIFGHLPVDFTYVDEFDRVRYFSEAKDRIFHRSPAVIGREVKFCHPAESLHVVEEIVEKFKSGEEDTASFWLDLRGRKILINYYALRNDQGHYKGVLEVSQDVTDIQKLKGQKRLLSWE